MSVIVDLSVAADGFRRQFTGWCRSRACSDEVLARCLGVTEKRLRALRRGELPDAAEISRLADAMEWDVVRLGALVERSREAAVLRAAECVS